MGIMEKKMEATIDLGFTAPPFTVPSCNVVSICYWGGGVSLLAEVVICSRVCASGFRLFPAYHGSERSSRMHTRVFATIWEPSILIQMQT